MNTTYSTELSDPAATAEYLAPYAEAIRQDGNHSYMVADSTAYIAGSTINSSRRFGRSRPGRYARCTTCR